MQDSQLRMFLSVADNGSFSRAEKVEYVSKQALMKQIKNLEEELSVTLFHRNKNGIRLTKEGRIFYDGAKHLLEEQRKLMLSLLQSSGQDSLRLGNVQHQALLEPVTQLFTKRFPEIQIERVIHPNHSGEFRVIEGIQDIAESFLSDMPIPTYDYTFHPLTKIPYHAIMDPKHPLADKSRLRLEEIAQYPITIFPMMVLKKYQIELEEAFEKTQGMIHKNMDVDHQIEALFSVLGTEEIVLSANPFIFSLKELARIPLETTWTRTYGIIYKEPMKPLVKYYISVAEEIYGRIT